MNKGAQTIIVSALDRSLLVWGSGYSGAINV